MARSPVAIIAPRWPGAVVVALVLALTLGTLASVLFRAGAIGTLTSADWSAVRFTVAQAFVSAAVSVVLAVPVARALARRQFRGRSALITLLGAPFILPVIVAVLGLLAIFGRNGILNSVLKSFDLPTLFIYGFTGVVLAHVFFNLPLAIRILVQGHLSVPVERYRLTASLGGSVLRLIEVPMLKRLLPGAFLSIFLICLTSFTVALILGGGPSATTVELAIYQAVRFDFSLDRAAVLAAVQMAIGACSALLVWRFDLPQPVEGGLDRHSMRWDGQSLWARVLDGTAILLTALFLVLPLGMVIWRGVAGLGDLPDVIWPAIGRSMTVSLVATALTSCAAVAMALRGGRAVAIAMALPLVASSLVAGVGLFLLLHPVTNPAHWALPVAILMNTLMALPFATRILQPSVEAVQRDYGRLAVALGLSRWTYVRLIVLPRIRRPLGFAAGLTAALSMGDLGVIALFATEQQQTLPLLMYQLMGSYRTDAAWGAALVLLGLCLVLFIIMDRGGRIDADL